MDRDARNSFSVQIKNLFLLLIIWIYVNVRTLEYVFMERIIHACFFINGEFCFSLLIFKIFLVICLSLIPSLWTIPSTMRRLGYFARFKAEFCFQTPFTK